MWEARNTEGFFWATQARGVERCVWEQAAWSEWATADGHAAATILYDLLEAFDQVAYQKLIDAAVRALSDEAAEAAASALPGGQARGA